MAALDLLLDDGGDLDLSTGEAILTQDDAAGIAQRLQIRLRLGLAEYALDVAAGVPWREQILVKGRDPEPARAVLTAQILSCPGVVGLAALDVQIDGATRQLTATFVALALPPETGLEDDLTPVAVRGELGLVDGAIDLVCLVEGPGGFL
jgi:hypothetical protein